MWCVFRSNSLRVAYSDTRTESRAQISLAAYFAIGAPIGHLSRIVSKFEDFLTRLASWPWYLISSGIKDNTSTETIILVSRRQ